MKKMSLFLVFIFTGIVLIGSFPLHTSACSCAELPSVEEEYERSQAVFSGKVVEIIEKRKLNGITTKSVLFEVSDAWKGVHESQVIITTGQGGGDCGIDFKEGLEYLVYANDSTMYGAKSLVTVICDRTNELTSSQEDLKVLGEGKQPSESVDLTRKHGGQPFYLWVGGIFAICLIVLFFILKRRK